MSRLLLALACAFGATLTLAADAENRISVTGHARHLVEPDMAEFSFAVVRAGDNVEALKADTDRIASAVIELAERLGVARRDVAASAVNVRPNVQYDRDGAPRIMGATVERTVHVTLRDLDQYVALVDGALAAKINRIDEIQMASSKQAEHDAEALRLAIEDAKREAEQTARHFGVQLTRVVDVTVMDVPRGWRPQSMQLEAAASARGGGFRPGTIAIERRISAQFQFE